MRIILEISAVTLVYFIGYEIGFKTGIRTIVSELNKLSKEISDKAKNLRKENDTI